MSKGVFSVLKDKSFSSMVITQFLGAFNDNIFKQTLILLFLTTAVSQSEGKLFNAVAGAVFAFPFVLFSLYAGFCADRFSKKKIIVIAKWMEVLVMSMGTLALYFYFKSPYWLLVVLFFMGTQSALFGPSKYGILPEILKRQDLSRGNGVIQLTTFLAIIFGMMSAGLMMKYLSATLYIAGFLFIIIAFIGTLTSYGVKKVPAADPKLKFQKNPFVDFWNNLKLLRKFPILLSGIFTTFFFWFMGAVLLTAINEYGIYLMKFSESQTSYLLAIVSMGIGLGSVLAAKLSGDSINFKLVPIGIFLSCLAMIGLFFLPYCFPETKKMESKKVEKSFEIEKEVIECSTLPIPLSKIMGSKVRLKTVGIILFALGLCCGLFIVPIQTYLQDAAPQDKKGCVLAMYNFLSFIGIFIASGFYYLTGIVFKLPANSSIGILSLLTIVFGIWCSSIFNKNFFKRFDYR